jgi:RecJ-like exonuclease
MNAEAAVHRTQDCPECRGTGKISARNCRSCGATGQIIVHSHEHRHGETLHDHPHPHAEPHRPGDATEHDHGHRPAREGK